MCKYGGKWVVKNAKKLSMAVKTYVGKGVVALLVPNFLHIEANERKHPHLAHKFVLN